MEKNKYYEKLQNKNLKWHTDFRLGCIFSQEVNDVIVTTNKLKNIAIKEGDKHRLEWKL